MDEEVKSHAVSETESEGVPLSKVGDVSTEPSTEPNVFEEDTGKPNGDDGLEVLEHSESVENHVENNVDSEGGENKRTQEFDAMDVNTSTPNYESQTADDNLGKPNSPTFTQDYTDSENITETEKNGTKINKETDDLTEKVNDSQNDDNMTSECKGEVIDDSHIADVSKSNEMVDESQTINDSLLSESQLENPLDDSRAEKTNEDSQENETLDDNQAETSNEDIHGQETLGSSQIENTNADSQAEETQKDNQVEKTIDESEGEKSTEDSQANISFENKNLTVDKSTADDDDIENPKFENAPEPTEQPVEDHSQALDPFDALLKDIDEVPTEKSSISIEPAATNLDDDDNDADNHHDDDIPPDDVPHDVSVEEVGQGEDEEVCLLPDMEREISEADREKALETSKLLQQESQHKLECAEVTETEAAVEADTVGNEVEADAAENEVEGAIEALHEDTADKEKDTGIIDESLTRNIIQEIGPVDNPCFQCKVDKPCTFKFLQHNAVHYLCSETCLKPFLQAHPRYSVNEKKYNIEEIVPTIMVCSECEEEKTCYFYYNSDGENTNYCSLTCLYSMMADERHKYVYKRKVIKVQEIDETDAPCDVCASNKCLYSFHRYGEHTYVCSHQCIKVLNAAENGRYRVARKKGPHGIKKNPVISVLKQPLLKLKVISNATDKYLDEGYKIQAKTPAAANAAREDRERSFIRRCVQCYEMISGDDKNLSWETMDFCNEMCLQRYQNVIGSKCANCSSAVNHTSLGKYCVRFGYDIRQFCCSTCLEEFKKGLKICCYCQRDISTFDGFLAPVGDKGQFKDFCSQQCVAKFEQMSKNPIPQPVWAKCAVCSVEKMTTIEIGCDDKHSQRLCSDPCFAAFKFVNTICPDQCRWCKKYFERKSESSFTIYADQSAHCFCSKACMNVYISNTRHIVPCHWCKVKKYNFDMIRRTVANSQTIMMCSLNCLNLYQVSVNAISSRRIKCDMCKRTSQAQYHLTMSDATVRNFCTYQCVMSFQAQYAKHGQPMMVGEQPAEQQKAVPTGAPRRTYNTQQRNSSTTKQQPQQTRSNLPVISNVQSLASPPAAPAPTVHITRGKSKRLQHQQQQQQQQIAPPVEPEPPRQKTPPPPPKPLTPPPPPPPKIYNHVLVKTLPPVEVANKATMTKPMTVTKGVSCRPHPCTKECQTDPSLERRVLIPVPVPIYVPVPIAMYSLPFPIPVPIPIPIPTPVFIPTTRNSAKGILKEITKIHDKMPTDPFEAELLMMAEMVAGDKKKSESDSETDDENDEGFSPDAMDGGNAFGEDVLQMALKMASEYEEPPVDLESAMTASTITPSSHPGMPGLEGEAAMHHHHQMLVLEQQRAVAALRAQQAAPPVTRGKRAPPAAAPASRSRAGKKRRAQEPTPAPEPLREPVEKPDANMCLKYTFGVNAWKQWVMTKNAEIEKSSIRRKPFKSEILQLTADELNYSLCLFVKEVRKPNGSEYAPDTIYYLVLGIQQYLFENGRIDNIFTDPYYEKFTECLDEVARKFSVLYNDSQYIVTRVEEEHLWESKQLGAHSPHVLLSTLMFFNTKHFNLVTVEEHMQLSFSHIMKHWKRSPNQAGAAKLPGSRNVLLRFYPPQSALEANSRKKKVYEQQENEENPLRCPVKLYEFYISKCPESVRTRNDVFYLLPERSCVPDSPVWYSTQALGRDALAKMLHRVKMVKEINIALLTS